MFRDVLRAARLAAGLTQAELARRISISKDLYNKYERTDTRPSFETLRKIANELNVTTDYLLEQTASGKTNAIPPASPNSYIKIFGRGVGEKIIELTPEQAARLDQLLQDGLLEDPRNDL